MALGNIFSLLSQSGILNNTQQSQSAGGDVLNLMGALLGGGETPPAGEQSQTTGDEVGHLLGSLLGGAQTPAASGQAAAPSGQASAVSGQNASDGVLDMILNVMQTPAGLSAIQPIVNQVAAKVGIPPETALIAVTFVIRYLATNHGTKIGKGEDMTGILQQHSDASFVRANDISTQLANKTGLDSQTAANAMAEVFSLLGVNP